MRPTHTENNEMNEDSEKKTAETQPEQPEKKANFLCLYIAIGCIAAGCILLGLAFAIKGAGVYLLLASRICQLAALSLLTAQKKNGASKATFPLIIVSYVVLFAAAIVILTGMVVSGTQK